MKEIAPSIAIRLDEFGTMYVKRSLQPSGAYAEATVPKPGQAAIARLLHGTWLLNRYSSIAGTEVRFNAPEGHHFVSLPLLPNESWCFDQSHLAGFSGNVILRTFVSLQAAALVVGRPICHIATGPGLLLLLCWGKPEFHGSPDSVAAFSPNRLAAWTADSCFGLRGSARIVDLVLNTVQMRPTETHGLIVDADQPGYAPRSALLRMLHSIYRIR
jgi:hypothetical protein